ncbi:hypothetical protein BU24DRAFT_357739 [Aaosphaeria arxii CBS 175.79]|uniref:Endoplasmic reticulum junction formation protein lunapark n=1 Tax=Aaosphaeria arxii CBS 175.79 TaxID=1450172 RepID=A0A6A5XA01_9PLEO|nr:uncharacterized protein BU24DRAFT_357739 [Aaosphaeria arxii CBS 175.79]KAF2009771.1 hypothetical protein BU24DRAFT_357739 [Aaosphaeria arxii CBS 175.79]
MVTFWPWKSAEDAASFEKTLSTLSEKITRTATRNDALRQRSRRVRVMWTLYAGFAYILAALLLLLVTGWRSWGATEVSIMSGGPVIIYTVRTAFTTYYDYRISKTESYLESLQSERDATIERLKAATKYNSTQQLLEKYGSPPKSKDVASPSDKKTSQGPQHPPLPQGPRTNMAPPPTANIQHPPGQQQFIPQRPESAGSSSPGPSPVQALPSRELPGADFAPNAFGADTTKQYSSSAASTFMQPHWYDRILDALLGEDETQPKNRLAMICSECRLVNGQAPPGTRTLEDIGRWRCGGCGAWNGKEKVKVDAVANLVQDWEAERQIRAKELGHSAESDAASDSREYLDESLGAGAAKDSSDEVQPLARTTRSKKSKGKK